MYQENHYAVSSGGLNRDKLVVTAHARVRELGVHMLFENDEDSEALIRIARNSEVIQPLAMPEQPQQRASGRGLGRMSHTA